MKQSTARQKLAKQRREVLDFRHLADDRGGAGFDPRKPENMPPLFIPLKAVHFDAFADGSKDTEYRVYGIRWHELTCRKGRPVLLSRGYGKMRRLRGRIVDFWSTTEQTAAFAAIYPDHRGLVACIKIEVFR